MYDIKYLSIPVPEDILKLENYGDFNDALDIIDARLKENIPQALRGRLELEKVRIDRLRREYVYSYDEALSILQKEIRDFKVSELDKLKDEGYADWSFVNGSIKFHRRFFKNIIKTCPEIAERLINKEEDASENKDKFLDDTIDEIMDKGHKGYYIHINAKVKLKKEASETGKIVKVYIPIPILCQQVKKIDIIKTHPEAKFISPQDHPQRTVYFEKEVCGEDEFSVEYSYENNVEYKRLDASKVSEKQPAFDTEEVEPHIVFTPYLKAITAEIIGDEKNPLKKARKIYDFITANIKYSYMREYLTIENIPEYAALNLKGDCGVQALLFITLCRIAKIPARWQSGLYVTPNSIGNHDWAQFYIEPYGWLFADLSFGGSAFRKGNTKRWDFYFGNIDPFRMIANSKFQYDFVPEKKFLRSDPYDNQRGEVEYSDGSIYFDGYDSIRDVVEMHEI